MPTTLKPNTIYKDKEGWYYRVFAQVGECVFAGAHWCSVENAASSEAVHAYFSPEYDSWQEVDAEGNAVVGRYRKLRS